MSSYSDPIAAIVGMSYGGRRNSNGKTWAGTTAYFVSGVALVLIGMAVLGVEMTLQFVTAVVAAVAVAAGVERYVTILDDNFIVTMVFAVIFEAFAVHLLT